MDGQLSDSDWQRVTDGWSLIGELAARARDRAEALHRLETEMGFDPEAAGQIVDLRIGDLVQFARSAVETSESAAHAEWQVRGRGFTPREFPLAEREPWSQWIRDGVENGWLTVMRLREPGILRHLSRIDDDRAIYIEHPITDSDPITVQTSIAGTYEHGDDTLVSEISGRMIQASDGAVDDETIGQLYRGSFAGHFVQLDGRETAARSFVAQGWWAVAVSVDPITTAYVTGPGDEIPDLDLVTVQSFSELDDQTPKRRSR